MKHRERLASMKVSLQGLLARIEEAERRGELPKGFDMDKLEKAYDEILNDYAMVLKKREK
ncbi:hypothetical protein M1589_04685 [Candidatus Marsarchaeota archaeon]|jgi:hypothetical protein|nr:hypothetical protein [Candidatus Marsarchaeota archaeon]MCL5115408.1 hypothetical protein [Candidatus Marsarchaeota archaeon]